MTKPINFKEEINKELKSNRSNSHTELDTTTFRASSMGYCPRQILLNKIVAKVHDSETMGRFQIGDFIHDWIQQKILPSHPTMHENQVKVELGDITIKGHYDCYDLRDETVYDFKSRSSWYRFEPPYNYHLDQLEVYMRALGVNKAMMVYVSKSDLTVETWPDHFNQSEERDGVNGEDQKYVRPDDERWKDIVEKAQKVHRYLEKNGFPKSIEEVNNAFKPCRSDDCMGCKFEDGTEFDFSHLKELGGDDTQ